MTDPTDNEETANRRVKTGDKGEGEQAGSGVAKLLTTRKAEQVAGEHRHLVAGELIEAIVEFFSELPMRASANIKVTWEKAKNNAKSFAIVNWIVEVGEKAVREFARTRGVDANGLKQKNKTKPTVGMKPGLSPLGPTGAQ